MKVYEIGVYNSIIRKIIRSGGTLSEHNNISPEFENTLYFERVATSEEDARIRVNYEYPKSLGYVIDYVNKVRDNE
jgi:hypothetical protein|tara:strand:+ start:5318 stop:5545 length:228 start_codon:yes stop_codon:yes gene_type:complete